LSPWCLSAGAVLIAVLAMRSAEAQGKPGTVNTAAKTARSTLTGVYTAGQAAKGEETYYNLCISCHPKGAYAGQSFKSNWSGRPLSDLYDWVLNKMPKNDPGSLTPAEAVEVIGYILQENKLPAGKTPLPTGMKPLLGIRIELK
jgi:mono/diheme cytochrome c family protein